MTRIDVTSAFQGFSVSLQNYYQMIGDTGWSVKTVKFDKKEGAYVAEATDPYGESAAKTGPTVEMAVRNLFLAIQRKHHMRGASVKLAMWQYHWKDKLKEIAEAYAKAPIYDPKAASAFMELARDSQRRAEQLNNHLHVEVTDNPEPYPNAQAQADDIHKRRHYEVSRANSDHPLWTPEQNVAFRTVHDVLGHAVSGGDFGWDGENMACQAHFPLLSSEAQKALFTECIAQTAYALHYRSFGPQKVALFPQFYEPAQAQEGVLEGHQGVHPSQSFAPVAMPAIEKSPPVGRPWGSEIAPHEEALGLTPVMSPVPAASGPGKWPTAKVAAGFSITPKDREPWLSDPDAYEKEHEWMTGQCATYATTAKDLRPDLKMGVHNQLVPVGDSEYDHEAAEDRYGPDESKWVEQRIPQHYFVHDNKYAYDADGTHPLPYDKFDETQYDIDPDEPHYMGYMEGNEDEAAWHFKRTHPQLFGKTAAVDPSLKDPNEDYESGSEILADQNAYGDPLNASAPNKSNQTLYDSPSDIDTGWAYLNKEDPGDLARMKQAIVAAFRSVLLSPKKDLMWNAVQYQHIMHIPADVKDPAVYLNTLENQRQEWNVKNFGEQARYAHQPWREMYPQFEHIIYQQNLKQGRKKAKDRAWRELQKWKSQEERRIEKEEEDLPEEKRRNSFMLEHEASKALSQRIKNFIAEKQQRLDFAAAAQPQTELFPEYEPQEPPEMPKKYGGIIYNQLQSVAQVSDHVDDILKAAYEDVHQYGGKGYHFRAAVTQMGMRGVGPKVASFAWLLLQPMTSQLATIDVHMMDVLGSSDPAPTKRDYYKRERELQAGRDAAGYHNVPLGLFQWGMWDNKRTGPESHQDHSAFRVLDPTSFDAINWNQKEPSLRGEQKWQEPDWWAATKPERDRVGEEWNQNEATWTPDTKIPYKTAKETVPQQTRRWEQYAPYSTGGEVWRSPNTGWSVQHHTNPDTVQNIGSFLNTCWQGQGTPEDISGGFTGTEHTLHDPVGIPRAGFYVNRMFDEPFVTQVDTPHHKALTPEQQQAVEEFARDTEVAPPRFLPKGPPTLASWKFSNTRIPWFTHPISGERIMGLPGESLMQHVRATTQLSTPEVWSLVSDAGKQ